MAYKSNYNPDALPAHAEPEQAAQMLAGGQPSSKQPRPQGGQPRPSGGSYKPQPPLPSGRDDRYDRDRYDRDYDRDRRDGRDRYDQGRERYDQDRFGRPPAREDSYGRRQPGAYDQYGQDAPPAQGYGQGPPPTGGHGRPSPVGRPPPTPAPGLPPGADPTLFPLFKTVDKDNSGQLTENELRLALVNGDYSAFDIQTVRMMITMFDMDKSGSINFDEFCGLWGFLASWRELFDKFDVDRSGKISYKEFQNALGAFGYRLTPTFIQLLFKTYDKRSEGEISFDLFGYDEDRDGYITLSFEEFLTEILRHR
ncbi:MAG: hypothetical protein M1814_001493 [Vezdaea aestivalis]|nr:MAG: hypothetical protein M1814_001493 [Vezdaea aestivalis]